MGKNGTLNDGLNEYQLVKKSVKVENNTVSGSVKRHRVSDQTVFDKMFIEGLLKIHHHEAAHMFIDDLARSGSSVPSVDLTKINVSTGTKGSSVAEKRMIFSNSFRSRQITSNNRLEILVQLQRYLDVSLGFFYRVST